MRLRSCGGWRYCGDALRVWTSCFLLRCKTFNGQKFQNQARRRNSGCGLFEHGWHCKLLRWLVGDGRLRIPYHIPQYMPLKVIRLLAMKLRTMIRPAAITSRLEDNVVLSPHLPLMRRLCQGASHDKRAVTDVSPRSRPECTPQKTPPQNTDEHHNFSDDTKP